ncbi:hypothetical protein ES703_103051 [subsurface metagenome]
MSAKRPTVEIDGEFLLNRVEAIERCCIDIRKGIAQGVFQPASPAGINIRAIEWRTKGSEDARDDDPWAWAFGYNQDGSFVDEARQLVQEIQRTGKVEIDGYEITLGGRDKKLLNRTKLGSQERRR